MNTKQIPFRYPEELEQDIKELYDNLQRYRCRSKNEAISKGIETLARLNRIVRKFWKPKIPDNHYSSEEVYISDLIDGLEKLLKHPGKKDITKLDLKGDIKKKGPKK